ncbi:MAG: hypothetical protein B6244_14560, partial [Candidatus Cloacimonetes bacterium 4572_55]
MLGWMNFIYLFMEDKVLKNITSLVIIGLLAIFSTPLMALGQVQTKSIDQVVYGQYEDGEWYIIHQGQKSNQIDMEHLTVRLITKSPISDFEFSTVGLPDLTDTRGRIADGFYELEIPPGLDPFVTAEKLEQSGEFDEVSFTYFIDVEDVPDDPYFFSQWGLEKISTDDAWDHHTNTSNVIVAVIDVGGDYNHDDLAGNLWPDIGYDFEDNDSDPFPDDDARHGTKVAGVVGAVTNNNTGIAGVAGGWNGSDGVRLMHFDAGYREQDADGDWHESLRSTATAASIDAAAVWGADVINMSFSSPQENSAIKSAIDIAVDDYNVVCVAAVGNYREGGPTNVRYPAALSNVIAVGATTENDVRKEVNDDTNEPGWGSCYGPELDVMAPGIHIYTTDISGTGGSNPGDYYLWFNGTSAAAPHVAGLAALIRSIHPGLGWQSVRATIRNTALNVPAMDDQDFHEEYGYGRINAYNALRTPTISGDLDTDFLTVHDYQTMVIESGADVMITEALIVEGALIIEPNVNIVFDDYGELRVRGGGDLAIGPHVQIAFGENGLMRIEGGTWGPLNPYGDPNIVTIGSSSSISFSSNGAIESVDYCNMAIEQGVEFSFASNSIGFLFNQGHFTVNGTEEHPVVFTSADQTPGSWGGMAALMPNSDSGTWAFDHAVIKYAVTGLSNLSRGVLDNCTIQHNTEYGISAIGTSGILGGLEINRCVIRNNQAAGLYLIDSEVEINCSEISQNEAGVILEDSGHLTISSSNIFNNEGLELELIENSFVRAENNWWFYQTESEILADVWADESSSLILEGILEMPSGCAPELHCGQLSENEIWAGEINTCADVIIPDGVTLTIAQGATINLEYTHKIIVESGGFLILNDASIIAQNATFIDDSSPPEPMIPGNAIIFEGSGQLTASNSVFTTIEENQEWDGIRLLDGATALLDHCVLDNAVTAIYAGSDVYLQLHQSALNNCQTGIMSDQAGVDIWDNTIHGGTNGVIFSDGYFAIEGNDIHVDGIGIEIFRAHNSARVANDVTNNDIQGAHIGISIYDSQVRLGYHRNDYPGNRVTNSDIGVISLNESGVSFYTNTIQDTRQGAYGGPEILFTGDSQLLIAHGSNVITDRWINTDTIDAHLVECVGWDGITQYDIAGNTWTPYNGSVFEPSGAFGFFTPLPPEELLARAEAAEVDDNIALAVELYQQVISLYPDTREANLSVKRLFALEKHNDQNYALLRSYYESGMNDDFPKLDRSFYHFIILCYVMEEDYPEAIDLLQAIIADPAASPEQVTFAEIDLDYVTYLMDGTASPTWHHGYRQQDEQLSRFQDHRLRTQELLQTLIPSDGRPDHEHASQVSDAYGLFQNYPNPFNPTTTIRYALPIQGDASLRIYNSAGQLVRTLSSGSQESGEHSATWDGKNDRGQE